MTAAEPAFRLDGRVAVVTGAGGGIGASIVRSLADAGADVVVSDIDAPSTRRVAATVAGSGRQVLALPADVTDPASVDHLFLGARAWRHRLDILVCSAGVTSRETVWDTTLDEWERVVRVNLTGAFLCSQAALRILRDQQRGGRIIFIGSGVVHQGALLGHAAYAASKAGVHALAKTLARLGAPHRITANVIAPGITNTALLRATHSAEEIGAIARSVPLGIGSPNDIGAAAVFLAGDSGRHITGATLDVNGGQIIR
jgi:3-oxoacyl-[acyl-carrier protein] reductase